MADVNQLAKDVVQIVGPFIPVAKMIGDKVVDGISGEAGKSLWAYIVDRFKGTDSEATLDRTVAEPTNEFRQQALALEIAEVASKDPSFRDELSKLVAAATSSHTATQHATQNGGSENTISLVQGDNNTIIGRSLTRSSP